MKTANGQTGTYQQSYNINQQTCTRCCAKQNQTCPPDSFDYYTKQATQDYKSGEYNKAFNTTLKALTHAKNACDSSMLTELCLIIADANCAKRDPQDPFRSFIKKGTDAFYNQDYKSAYAYTIAAEKHATNALDSFHVKYNKKSIEEAMRQYSNGCPCCNQNSTYNRNNTNNTNNQQDPTAVVLIVMGVVGLCAISIADSLISR